ncbi:MAG: hypothetical protein WEE64_00690 [Dehalococcoidia bacterium]
MATQQLRDYIATETKEPITESEYRRKVEAARAAFVPVAELADALAYDHEGWREEDAEGKHADGTLIIEDEAWERVCREKERELARLVADEAGLR